MQKVKVTAEIRVGHNNYRWLAVLVEADAPHLAVQYTLEDMERLGYETREVSVKLEQFK
jgi:hypothetical protein